MNPLPRTIADKVARLKLLILDVDGVLTDGTLSYSETGELVKHFNSKDGFGIRMLMETGVQVAVITARDSKPLAKRMADLKIEHYYTGYDHKIAAFDMLIENLKLSNDEIGYVGDDILDLPVMRKVGLPIAVSDAHFYVREQSLWVTEAAGGKGAVREVADGIISTRTDLRQAYDRFLSEHVGKTKMDKL